MALPAGHKYLLLCGSRDIPAQQYPRMIEVVHSYVVQAWRRNWTLLLADGYGVDAQALRIAEEIAQHHTMRYAVYGVTVRPRNGAGMRNYTRMLNLDTIGRDRYLVAQSEQVICISNGQIFQRGDRYAEAYAMFNYARALDKSVTWWSEATGFGWPVVIDKYPHVFTQG